MMHGQKNIKLHRWSIAVAIQRRVWAAAESAMVYKVRVPTDSNQRYWSDKIRNLFYEKC